MNGSSNHDYLTQLRALAQSLHESGYLQSYPQNRRDELLRKGYLGPHPPHQALCEAVRRIKARTYSISPPVLDRMRMELGIEPFEVGDALEAAVEEIRPEAYYPPGELRKPPGMPFFWVSQHFGREMYFKIAFVAEKDSLREARLFIHSCHPPEKKRRLL